jgi:hypothetical protein
VQTGGVRPEHRRDRSPIAELLLASTAVVAKPLNPNIECEFVLLTAKSRPFGMMASAFCKEIYCEINNLLDHSRDNLMS